MTLFCVFMGESGGRIGGTEGVEAPAVPNQYPAVRSGPAWLKANLTNFRTWGAAL